MSRSSPRISIGLPVYNGERYVAEAIDSLLAQTFGDFELIISDNASTDETQQICETYQEKDRRVRYFRNQKNIGASRNFNRTFELSKGKLFKWAASDDLCEPDFLRSCLEVLDREPLAVLVYPKSKLINEKGEITSLYDDDLHLQHTSPFQRYRQLFQRLGLCNAQYGLMRSAALRQTHLMGNFIASDVCFLAELSLYGTFWVVPEHYLSRRFHPACSSSDRDDLARALQFYNPGRKARFFLWQWRHFFENLLALTRVPLSFKERAQVGLFVLYMGLANYRKLLRELSAAFRMCCFKGMH